MVPWVGMVSLSFAGVQDSNPSFGWRPGSMRHRGQTFPQLDDGTVLRDVLQE